MKTTTELMLEKAKHLDAVLNEIASRFQRRPACYTNTQVGAGGATITCVMRSEREAKAFGEFVREFVFESTSVKCRSGETWTVVLTIDEDNV